MDDNLGIILFVAVSAFIGFLVWLVKYVQKTSIQPLAKIDYDWVMKGKKL